MEIASKILEVDKEFGLTTKISIDKKIIIDLENKTIIVEGTKYAYSPTGKIVAQERFMYERDNIPEIKEVEEKKDVLGNILVKGVKAVPANPRFDIYAESALGKEIASMIQNTLDNL